MECPNTVEGKEGQVCPECGTEYKKMASIQAKNLMVFKQDQINAKSKNMLFKKDMFDGELEFKITNDMDKLAKDEADKDWKIWEDISSFEPEAQTTALGLKTIIEQNKIIIRQNELIYRQLKKFNEKSS